MAETYTLYSWHRDKLLYLLGEAAGEVADFIPLPEAMASLKIFVGKAVSSGIHLFAPPNPPWAKHPLVPAEWESAVALLDDIQDNEGILPDRVFQFLLERVFFNKNATIGVAVAPMWHRDP